MGRDEKAAARPVTRQPPESNSARAAREEKADDGSRTRDLELGKLALYQLSYVRAAAF
jgi:hypothetical protein